MLHETNLGSSLASWSYVGTWWSAAGARPAPPLPEAQKSVQGALGTVTPLRAANSSNSFTSVVRPCELKSSSSTMYE